MSKLLSSQKGQKGGRRLVTDEAELLKESENGLETVQLYKVAWWLFYNDNSLPLYQFLRLDA